MQKIAKFIWILVLFLFLFPSVASAQKIGWITDIHAGKNKKREVSKTNILYPKKYDKYLSKVFKKMKKQGITQVVATGDNTNLGEKKYAKKIVKLAKKYKMSVLWVKGNHDKKSSMETLEFSGSNYYKFKDYGNVRIIALNNTIVYNDRYGGLDDAQLGWLRRVLQTNKQVIVATHIPFLDGNGQFLPRYAEAEQIMKDSGNVQMVISGHYHAREEWEHNGIQYKVMTPLTKKSAMGGYAMIDTDSFAVSFTGI